MFSLDGNWGLIRLFRPYTILPLVLSFQSKYNLLLEVWENKKGSVIWEPFLNCKEVVGFNSIFIRSSKTLTKLTTLMYKW